MGPINQSIIIAHSTCIFQFPKDASKTKEIPLIELYWKCMTFTIASTWASAALDSNGIQLIKMKISTNKKRSSTARRWFGDFKTQHIYRWIVSFLTHHPDANTITTVKQQFVFGYSNYFTISFIESYSSLVWIKHVRESLCSWMKSKRDKMNVFFCDDWRSIVF